jgi:hypothetical protein
MRNAVRAFLLTLMLATAALAAGDWVVFKGQVNGPAKPGGIDLAAFKLKHYPGKYWDEGYYHQMYFPDGSWMSISFSFSRDEARGTFVRALSGQPTYKDYFIVDLKKARFDDKGFGFTIDQNRVRLEGNRYTVDFITDKTRAKVVFDIIAPSYTYGDGLVRYPDGETFMYYSLPISWAKVKLQAAFGGKNLNLEGYGDMNHDAGEMFSPDNPTNWQGFLFFGENHALVVVDHFANPKFGNQLIQRLVFADKHGHQFTSTEFTLKWDDWATAKDVPIRYPRHYSLTAAGGGQKLEVELRTEKPALTEDLFSNLPTSLRLIAQLITSNLWTVDNWSNYTITFHHDGQSDVYRGRGIVNWTNLEEEK